MDWSSFFGTFFALWAIIGIYTIPMARVSYIKFLIDTHRSKMKKVEYLPVIGLSIVLGPFLLGAINEKNKKST